MMIGFALRGLRRDWRGGDMRLLGLALVLAVAAVTSVGFFTDRVERALRHQGGELLGADLVIDSTVEPSPRFEERARETGLRTARTLEFPSVVLADGAPQLVQVKAVEPGYPLRGTLLLGDGPGTPALPAPAGPAPGEIWVEPRLLVLLGNSLGESLSLGETRFRIARTIELEPDRGGNLFQLAPRVMLGVADIPATGLVTPASRVHYRLLVAGPREAVAAFRAWSAVRLPPTSSLVGIEEARPELRAALDRGARFLALAALVSVLVTGAAVAMSTRRMVERQADAVAIMRCLGASSTQLRNVLLLRLGFFLLLTGALGSGLGFLAQFVLADLVGDWLAQELPAPSPMPLLTGLGTAALTLLGFALPSLLRLPRVPPLRVLRRDLGPAPAGPWVAGLSAIGALALLLFWQADDPRLAGRVLGGAVALLGVLALLALGLVRLAGVFQGRLSGVGRFGLATLSRHPGTTVLQMCGFGLGIMALLLLAVVRVDLLAAWERSLPPEAPNRFLINLQPSEVPALERLLEREGVQNSGLHPMIRGRLTRINGREVDPDAYENPRAQRLAAREFNLSWGTAPQSDNRVVAGRWWAGADASPQFSVETGVAETLGIRLGDTLTWWVAGQEVSAPVTSLRTVQWDSFNVNFFVVGTPSVLGEEPATYITSFHLPPDREALAVELVRAFPSVTLLDVSALMDQVRRVMDRGAAAVEYVFLFTLAAGLLVMVAGIQAGAETRRREAAILRTLGARRGQLLGAAAVELGTLGLLAGLMASLAASITGLVLARQIFGLEYAFNPWLWLAGSGGAALAIGLAGVLAAWPLVVRPPLASLRRAE